MALQAKKPVLELVTAIAKVAVGVENVRKMFVKRSRKEDAWRSTREEFVALHGISLEVREKEIYGLLGSNGSGKSTLLRIISTLMTPDSGRVSVFGYEIGKDDTQIRKLISRVSADAAFYKKLSARENLLYCARMYGIAPDVAEARCIEILSRLGLRRSAFYEPVEHMSRGMQQKVSIARAFLASPVLIILDEPTTGLDPKSRRDVQEFVLELRSVYNATVILTTHDMPEAERLCDRIGFISSGRLVAEGTAEELKAKVGPGADLERAFIELTGTSLEE